MAIKIQTRSTVIPVEIDDLKFGFDTKDENLERLRKAGQQLIEQGNKLNDDDEEGAKQLVFSSFDLMLGEGAGQKIYDKVGSVVACLDVLLQLKDGLEEELSKHNLQQSQQSKAMQYVQAKNKKNKNKNKNKRKK